MPYHKKLFLAVLLTALITRPALGVTSNQTQIQAFYRSGQTFITWLEDTTVTGEQYTIYRSKQPITTANLAQAKRIATINEGSSTFTNEITSSSPYQTHYIIEDATKSGVTGTQLADNVGLFVFTNHAKKSVTAYYAIVETINGTAQPLQPSFTLSTGITEHKALPQPVKVWFNGVKTLYTHWMDYSKWNPKYEGYAYNFWVGVPANGNAKPLPLQMHLHAYGESWQRYWTSGDAYGSGSPYNFPTVWLEPDDNRITWWYGYANNVKRGEAANSKSIIVNYTEQRLEYYLKWITSAQSPYKIKRNKMYLYGGSMGGSGTLSFGLRHPEWFAALYAIVPMTNYATSPWARDSFDIMWGTPAQNLPTNDGSRVYTRLNAQQYVLDHAGKTLPYTVTFHGRKDTIIDWATQGLPWIQSAAQSQVLGVVQWADTDHSSSFDIYSKDLFLNYEMEHYNLKLHDSYLTFTHAPGDDDPTGAIPSCRSSDPAYAYAWLGNSVTWSAVTDTTNLYQTSLRLRTDQCNWPSTGTVTVTLHRTKKFKPSATTTIHWSNSTSNGTVLQSGTVKLDSAGRLTIPGVQVSTGGSVLTITQ